MPQAPPNQACEQGKEEPRAGPHGMNPCMRRQGFERTRQGIPVTERSAKQLILSCSRLICSLPGAPASLTLLHPRCYDFPAGWSSLVARWAHNPKVGGSNPPPATNELLESKQVKREPETLVPFVLPKTCVKRPGSHCNLVGGAVALTVRSSCDWRHSRRRCCTSRCRACLSSSLTRSAYRLNIAGVASPVTSMQSSAVLPAFHNSWAAARRKPRVGDDRTHQRGRTLRLKMDRGHAVELDYAQASASRLSLYK